jgi:SAM-dependent methyltransferase
MTLFDKSAEYDAMLNRGLRLSGEDKSYFLAGRVTDLKAILPAAFAPRRIVDFGCGIGDSSSFLAEAFADAEIVGTDSAPRALAHARASHGSERVRFCSLSELRLQQPFDLAYVNGVFHHIIPSERPAALALLGDVLQEGAYLALFENNPYNPGTRLVMSRIPFDRDAQLLSARALRRLVQGAGFHPEATRFLFYFPRALAKLRFSEPWLARVPMGAQYYVLARRPVKPRAARS